MNTHNSDGSYQDEDRMASDMAPLGPEKCAGLIAIGYALLTLFVVGVICALAL